MLLDFIDLALHLDSVTVAIGDTRIILCVCVGLFHLRLSRLVRHVDQTRAYLITATLRCNLRSRACRYLFFRWLFQ